jgi:hypothetical protein
VSASERVVNNPLLKTIYATTPFEVGKALKICIEKEAPLI